MAEEGEDLKEHLIGKYGPRAGAMVDDPNNHLNRAGKAVGINFTSKRRIYPTIKAHALMEHVKSKDNDTANKLMEEMYKTYFEEAKNINDKNVLADVASRVGIDKAEAEEAIDNPDLIETVKQLDSMAKGGYRVTGVPFFIIEPKTGGRPIAFSGAQPPDIIAEQLELAAEE